MMLELWVETLEPKYVRKKELIYHRDVWQSFWGILCGYYVRMWLCRREYFGPVDQRVLLKRHYKSLMKFSMDFYTLVAAWNAPNKSISFSVQFQNFNRDFARHEAKMFHVILFIFPPTPFQILINNKLICSCLCTPLLLGNLNKATACVGEGFPWMKNMMFTQLPAKIDHR